MINLNAANMYNIAEEAQEKNRARFDAHLESTIHDCASRGETTAYFDEDDEMWRVLSETQKDDVVKELKNAGFFVGARRFNEPLFVSWDKKGQPKNV